MTHRMELSGIMLSLKKQMNSKPTYLEKSHLKWTVIFALFLSLFTFSSNYTNSISLQTSPFFQTEWVYETRRNFIVPTQFRKALREPGASLKKYTQQIFAFNKLIIIKLTKLAKAFLSILTTSSFFVQEATVQYPIEIDSPH
jgi:hypothetical protein